MWPSPSPRLFANEHFCSDTRRRRAEGEQPEGIHHTGLFDQARRTDSVPVGDDSSSSTLQSSHTTTLSCCGAEREAATTREHPEKTH